MPISRLFILFTLLLSLAFILSFSGCTDDQDDDSEDDDNKTKNDDDDDNDDNDDNDNDDNDDNDDDTPVTLDLEEGCNPFATSEECILPYPSAFFQTADAQSNTGFRVNYPQDIVLAGETLPIDVSLTNTADGVSPAGPLLIHFKKDLLPKYLTPYHEQAHSLSIHNSIALFNYETGERVMFLSEMDMNRKDAYPDRYVMIVRPLEPMEPGQRHIVAIKNNVTDTDGNPLESPEAFAVLRDGIPTTNDVIEQVRPQYELMFPFLDARGYARNELLIAWDFMVASEQYLLGPILSMREQALSDMEGTGLSYTITSVVDNPNSYLAKIVEGDFEVPTYLNGDSIFDYDEDHLPIKQQSNITFPFTMLIPKKSVTLQGPLPLVVFGHGIFGSGRSYLTGWASDFIQPLAEQAGAVLIATDWIGLSSGDLDLIIEEVLPDLNRIALVTDRLQQSLINNLTLTELALGDLSEDPQVKTGDFDLIDESKVYYYGVSLGGIQGTSFVSLSNRITRGVLAVPGSVWLNMIPRSTVWIPLDIYMQLFYPDPLLQQVGIALMQTWFDHSDPINLTRFLHKSPPPNVPAEKVIILQESIADCQVPNMTTEMLARAINIKQMTPAIYNVEGLQKVTGPTVDSVLTQYHLVDQTSEYYPPPENIPPTRDNGVHSDMCFMDHVIDQILHFMETGEIVQYCTGTCNPD